MNAQQIKEIKQDLAEFYCYLFQDKHNNIFCCICCKKQIKNGMIVRYGRGAQVICPECYNEYFSIVRFYYRIRQ